MLLYEEIFDDTADDKKDIYNKLITIIKTIKKFKKNI